MKPTQPDHWIGKTSFIARALFAEVSNIRAHPESDPLDRCFLFTGPTGNGKSTLAESFAGQLCDDTRFGLEMINGASLTVELVRQWKASGIYRPLYSGLSVKFIDEIDGGSSGAFMECRTYLSNLPPHTAVVATTNMTPEKLPCALQSRFQVWRFDAIPSGQVRLLLKARFALPDDTATDIADRCGGDVRQAIADAKAFRIALRVAA
jgi:DNA polymerase III delta prime subunit